MKTIEVTDEIYDKLMCLSKELNSQSHRCTRMPYMIQVSKKVEVPAHEGCGNEYWFGEGGHKLESLEEEKEVITAFLYDKYGKTDDEQERFHNLTYCEKSDILQELGYRELNVAEEDKLSNFFFTEKALRESYGEDVNTFLTGVRNHELEMVMTFLCGLSGGKLHV